MTEKDLVKKTQVKSAVEALLQLIKTTAKSSVSLIDGAKKIDLQFILASLPTTRHKIKLDLPHSIDEDVREVCIFVKDLDQKDREYEKTVFHYQALLKEKGVTKIAKIIPIKALRTDFSEPHNKRTLAKAYDLFLADGTIKGLLPALLGKIFYAQNKTVPRQVNLKAANLKEHLDKIIDNPECEISGKGSSSCVQIGHDKMTKDELISNTVEAVRTIADRVPGGRNNIKSMFIGSSETTAIPFYTNYVNPKDIDLPKEEKDELAAYTDDVTTVENALVYVRSDGHIKVLNNKRKSEIKDEDDVTEKKPKLEEIKAEGDGDIQTPNKKDKQSKANKKKAGKGKKSDIKGTIDNPKVNDVSDVIEIKEEIKNEEPKVGKKKSRKRKGNKEAPVESKQDDRADTSGKKKKMKVAEPDTKVLKANNSAKKSDTNTKASSKKTPKGKQNTKTLKK